MNLRDLENVIKTRDLQAVHELLMREQPRIIYFLLSIPGACFEIVVDWGSIDDVQNLLAVDEKDYESIDEIVDIVSDFANRYPWYPDYATDERLFESLLSNIEEASEMPEFRGILGKFREVAEINTGVFQCEACGSENVNRWVNTRWVKFDCEVCGYAWVENERIEVNGKMMTLDEFYCNMWNDLNDYSTKIDIVLMNQVESEIHQQNRVNVGFEVARDLIKNINGSKCKDQAIQKKTRKT